MAYYRILSYYPAKDISFIADGDFNDSVAVYNYFKSHRCEIKKVNQIKANDEYSGNLPMTNLIAPLVLRACRFGEPTITSVPVGLYMEQRYEINGKYYIPRIV
jgi:hypothetical protein